jgi:hypothetical protein
MIKGKIAGTRILHASHWAKIPNTNIPAISII